MSKLTARGRRSRPASAADPPSCPPSGDTTEFREIVQAHEAYLHAVAVRLSGDRELAKDLVQETLARALLHFNQFQPGTNIRAWLTTILSRLFLDQLKHEKVITKAGQQLVTLEVVVRDIDMTIPGVSDAALWEAVEALESDLRTIVELRYVQQLSYKEIADRLQLRVGTVGTRLMRAHEQLKQLLEQRSP